MALFKIFLASDILFGSHIEIETIKVEGFELTRETAKNKLTNIQTVLNTIEVVTASEVPDETTYLIHQLSFLDGKVRVGGRLFGGSTVPIKLPKIVIRELGLDEDGFTIKSVFKSILESLNLSSAKESL